ncbi:MAG TPA: ADP-ribosylglycohydrolase family protein [Steroidobacteraceae bacterium]|jgi:ADP-ribosylglycohydrolase|nr:ADP-ribosylglycohydrolase family protein [Steroidobacteraceae bacterium]
MDRPLANSYWVVPGRLLAGEHPAGRVELPDGAGRERVLSLVAAGFDCFIDLTEEGECVAYQDMLPASVTYLRRPIRDQRLPRRVAQMRRIQDEIASALAAGRNVYFHCRAGIGRTGTVAGCFLVEQGRDGEQALMELNTLWTGQCARAQTWPVIPQTQAQADYIRDWTPRRAVSARARRAAALAPAVNRASEDRWVNLEFSDQELAPVRGLRERFQGAMQGLAIGDALAAATQFRRAGTFAAVGDLLGGGPFDLPRGAWSDDTAMALCLAESLIERAAFDASDQLARYTRWQREGYRSATGQCLGITAATARALAAAQWRGRPLAESADALPLESEPLSRVAPIVLHFFATPEEAVAAAADSARVTSQSPLVLDACRLLAAMLHAALRGEPREQVLSPDRAVFGSHPLREAVAAVAARRTDAHYQPPPADGGALAVLELARWCLAGSANFRDGALRAINLGGDSDVIGAVYGQLAGAHYGLAGIPRAWRQALAQSELIAELADHLLQVALVELGEGVSAP